MKNGRFFDKLYRYTSWLNYVVWLFEVNILVVIFSLPMIAACIWLPMSVASMPIYYVASITTIPSAFAAISAIRNAQTNNSIWREYFQSFFRKFRYWLKIELIINALFIVLIGNIQFLRDQPDMRPLWWANIALLVILTTFVVNLLFVVREWNQSIRDAVVLTAKLAIVKSLRYNMTFLICLSVPVIFSHFWIYFWTFGISVMLLLCQFNFSFIVKTVH